MKIFKRRIFLIFCLLKKCQNEKRRFLRISIDREKKGEEERCHTFQTLQLAKKRFIVLSP